MLLPDPIQKLIDAFSRLPGIGPKTASRLTFFMLRADEQLARDLADALQNLKSSTTLCRTCFNITLAGREQCEVCADPERAAGLICVVEEPLDVLALERSGGFRGRYHVLHGALSPIEGIGPEQLKVNELMNRLQTGEVRELIIATNPSMEGDYTADYLKRRINSLDIRVTRLARGLPMGGDLEYADQHTLRRAIEGRQEMD